MTEPTDTFERDAFRAAGPVFLVALGILLLTLLGILFLIGGLPPAVAAAFGVAGALFLVLGISWGSAQRSKQGRLHRQRPA